MLTKRVEFLKSTLKQGICAPIVKKVDGKSKNKTQSDVYDTMVPVIVSINYVTLLFNYFLFRWKKGN